MIAQRTTELTVRGVILGALITLVFTAANVYLGLKVGLTFASSIPAAVISMAVLRWFRGATIHENNIVQTIASAAGTLSAIIFVLPGLVMVGWWTGFPFWESFGICAAGGILGVMYSVPLRRAMVTTSDLPYPEGVACAEVLHVGMRQDGEAGEESAHENRAGLMAVLFGALMSGGYAVLASARLFFVDIAGYFKAGAAATGMQFTLSFALMGVGHLVGLAVGIAMLVGILIAWAVFTPLLSAMHPVAGSAAEIAVGVWSHQVRFIGAGTIGIAAIWALVKLARPVIGGVASSIAAARRLRTTSADDIPRVERDIPIQYVVLISIACLIPLAILFAGFLSGGALASLAVPLVIAAILYTIVAGFFVAAACGYMAGLVGSSNSPVSGIGILSILGAALMLILIVQKAGPHATSTMVAYALFVVAAVFCVATISNDNLQDLKTGQLVDATPWRQQIALVIGVIFGAIVIPPVLDVLARAYGFTGAPNLHVVAGTQPLAAPQAVLISTLAKGVIGGTISWSLIGIGALVGIVVIIIDELLGAARKMRLAPLAVALGIYLPPSATLPIVAGAIVGYYYTRWAQRAPHPERSKRMGILLASGLIVGESIWGVVNAGLIVAFNKPSPIAIVGDAFQPYALWLGIAVFIALTALAYRRLMRTSV